MAFIINPDGTIRVDTADELRQVLDIVKNRQRAAAPEESGGWASPQDARRAEAAVLDRVKREHAEGYCKLFDEASELQKRLLRFLLAAPDWIADVDLRAQMGVSDNEQLRPILIGLVRRAAGRGVQNPVESLATREAGGKRNYSYRARLAFREAMSINEVFPKKT